jgi:hypothetical protein
MDQVLAKIRAAQVRGQSSRLAELAEQKRSRLTELCDQLRQTFIELEAELQDQRVDQGYMLFVGTTDGPVYVGWCEVGGTQFLLDWVRMGSPLAALLDAVACTYDEYVAWMWTVREHHFKGRWFNRTEGFEAAMRALMDNNEENEADGQSTDKAD